MRIRKGSRVAVRELAEQTVEQVCHRTKRRPSTQETLGVSCGRPSGQRLWMTLSTGSERDRYAGDTALDAASILADSRDFIRAARFG